MFLEHGVTVDETLLEGHPVGLETLQLLLHLLRNLNLVLPQEVELVMQGLKLRLDGRDVCL